MSIQDLGSIGELVGAIAVILTLIYLSVQTRQARIAAEQSAKFSELHHTSNIMNLYTRWREFIVSEPHNSAILAKSKKGLKLSEEEDIHISIAFDDMFFTACFSYQSGITDSTAHDASGDVQYLIKLLTDYPCAEVEWHRVKHIVECLGVEFVQRIDEELAKMQFDT